MQVINGWWQKGNKPEFKKKLRMLEQQTNQWREAKPGNTEDTQGANADEQH